jgi:hypothetical protein
MAHNNVGLLERSDKIIPYNLERHTEDSHTLLSVIWVMILDKSACVFLL